MGPPLTKEYIASERRLPLFRLRMERVRTLARQPDVDAAVIAERLGLSYHQAWKLLQRARLEL